MLAAIIGGLVASVANPPDRDPGFEPGTGPKRVGSRGIKKYRETKRKKDKIAKASRKRNRR
jgi:hypothetical protein